MAASAFTLKLIHGASTLNLMSGRYTADFIPPDADVSFSVSVGSSANRVGGGTAVGWKANNRSLSFRVRVLGDSEREISRGIEDIRAFLNRGTPDNPVKIEFKPNSDTPRPIWGQDGTRYYEVVTFGGIVIDPLYGSRMREKATRILVTVNVKPYAVGLAQAACQAKGGVVHDIAGANDGRDRGISIPTNTNNYFTNPIYGHPTWNTGWSEGANLDAYENSDPAYCIWGIRSAKLQATGATRVWYQAMTLTIATYTLSFYAKRPDGDTVDANTCQVYFNNTLQTSTYTSVGDGWWRVSYTGTATNVAANYGCGLAAAQTVYVTGFQNEPIGFATPFHSGDMYGYVWSGTAHASVTTQTTGYVRLELDAKTWNVGQGTIRAVVKWPTLGFGSNPIVFYEDAGALRLYYDTATTKFIFTDNVNTITGGSALAAGDTVVLHVAWDSGRLQMYVNGSSIASGASYTPSTAAPTYLYIGSTPSPSNHHNQIFQDLTIYGEALTTAQVLADYTNIAPLVADGQRVNTIPYFWTKDGDNVVDTYDDNSYDNWGVLQGVPGNAPADTEYYLNCPTEKDTSTLSLWDTREFMNPGRVLYFEQLGTVDANSSGGQYKRTAIGTTEAAATSTAALWASDHNLYRFVEGREMYAVCRARDAGTGKLRQQLLISNVDVIYGQQWVAAPGTFFRMALVPSIYFPRLDTQRFSYANMTHAIAAKNTTASPNVDVDFYCLMPRPLAVFTSGSKSVIRGNTFATEYNASAYNVSGTLSDNMDARPDTNNVLMVSNYGTPSIGADSTVTTFTFAKVTLWPRYAVL